MPYVKPYPCTGGFFKDNLRLFVKENVLPINPDTFIISLIAQVTVLISNNHEYYRPVLVEHTGKKTIKVENGADIWERLAASIPIKDNNLSILLNSRYSTTTADVMNVRYAMIMAMFAPYYDYAVSGIGAVSTADDWQAVSKHLDSFRFLADTAKKSDKPGFPYFIARYCRKNDPVDEWLNTASDIIHHFQALAKGDQSKELVNWCNDYAIKPNKMGGQYMSSPASKMALVDKKGVLLDEKSRRRIDVTDMPSELLSLDINFVKGGGWMRYLAGNKHYRTKGDRFCLAKPTLTNITDDVCRE